MSTSRLYSGVALIVGGAFFILAVTSTFTLSQLVHTRFDPLLLVFINFLAGFVGIVIGYESMVTFGGRFSLGIANFASRLSGSRQIIEVIEDPPEALTRKLINDAFLIYVPLLVFLISVALSWDIFTLDTSRSGLAQPLFRTLDIFARNVRVNPVLFSVELVPILLLLTFVAGTIPSIALPYFGRFKVTGVNSAPFHKGFLISTVGIIAGASAIFTLSGLFYEVLLTTQEPLYYHYSFLEMVGLSLYYAVGSYFGLGRAESMITKMLESSKSEDAVFRGKVTLS
jgi:hypothetical protein